MNYLYISFKKDLSKNISNFINLKINKISFFNSLSIKENELLFNYIFFLLQIN